MLSHSLAVGELGHQLVGHLVVGGDPLLLHLLTHLHGEVAQAFADPCPSLAPLPATNTAHGVTGLVTLQTPHTVLLDLQTPHTTSHSLSLFKHHTRCYWTCHSSNTTHGVTGLVTLQTPHTVLLDLSLYKHHTHTVLLDFSLYKHHTRCYWTSHSTNTTHSVTGLLTL